MDRIDLLIPQMAIAPESLSAGERVKALRRIVALYATEAMVQHKPLSDLVSDFSKATDLAVQFGRRDLQRKVALSSAPVQVAPRHQFFMLYSTQLLPTKLPAMRLASFNREDRTLRRQHSAHLLASTDGDILTWNVEWSAMHEQRYRSEGGELYEVPALSWMGRKSILLDATDAELEKLLTVTAWIEILGNLGKSTLARSNQNHERYRKQLERHAELAYLLTMLGIYRR